MYQSFRNKVEKKEKTEENTKQQCKNIFFNNTFKTNDIKDNWNHNSNAYFICLCACLALLCVCVCSCMCLFEWECVCVCVCMCTNTCTASGKPASVSFKCTLIVLFRLFPLYLLTIILSHTQQLHSHLSPIPHPNPQLPSAHPNPQLTSAPPIYLCWPPPSYFYGTHIFQLCYDV